MEHSVINLESLLVENEEEVLKIIMNHGYTPRVVQRDGTAMVVTRDYRRDRVNLIVDNGLVMAAFIG